METKNQSEDEGSNATLSSTFVKWHEDRGGEQGEIGTKVLILLTACPPTPRTGYVGMTSSRVIK
jgi:hypothetical protein